MGRRGKDKEMRKGRHKAASVSVGDGRRGEEVVIKRGSQ